MAGSLCKEGEKMRILAKIAYRSITPEEMAELQKAIDTCASIDIILDASTEQLVILELYPGGIA